MYQNIYVSRKDGIIHVWDDIQGHLQFPQSKFKYAYKPQPGGKFLSIYGEELTKVYNFDERDYTLLESDVHAELKVLRDLYPDSDEPSTGHKLGVIDIEVNTEGGYPNLQTADKEITAISLYDEVTKTCYVFVNDKDGKVKNEERDDGNWCPQIKGYVPTEKDKVTLKIRSYDDEDNLLMAFLDKWQECSFTIISGWNADLFDMPYLYIRIKNVLGAKVAKFLSPIGSCYINAHRKTLMCGGISIMDYILLYKKFSGKNEPSYALANIGPKIVNIKKLTYDGNLNDLYKNDIEKFIEYNINDVKIVVALDKKLQFIDLARRICHVGHVPYENFHMSSRYLDGAILLFLKRNGGFIAPNKPVNGQEEYEEKEEEDEEGFSGAYVKPPVPGRYHWVFDLDLTSMYPNIIISINISPETKVVKMGNAKYTDEAKVEKRKLVLAEIDDMEKKQKDALGISDDDNAKEKYIQRRCVEFDMDFHVQKKLTDYSIAMDPFTPEEVSNYLKKTKYTLSSNGVFYKTDKQGVIPQILSKWFEERKAMRKKAADCRKAGDMEGYFFNNQRQQVWKILLNSMYGVLGLPIFRFYDVDNAEAVTTTGVTIIKTTAKAINAYYNKELGNTIQKDYVIYTDTDSCFVDAIPIIKKRYPNMDFNNDEEMTKAIMSVTGEVQSYVNKFYDLMAERMFNLTDKRFGDKTHTFDAKQEVISKTSFWLAKKRYAQWIIHKEGALLKEPEMEVKGIDVVRTSFPIAFREVMKEFLKKLLTDVPQKELDELILSFKEKIPSIGVIELAKNTSVKYVSVKGKNYNPDERRPFEIIGGSPAQVKASLAYNDLLIKWGLAEQYEPIHNSQKIKWIYLRQNPFGLDALAMKADGTDPKKIMDYINTYVDRNKMFEKELKSKIANNKKEGIYDIMKWEFPNESMKIAEQFFGF